jgi:hypothetical protein
VSPSDVDQHAAEPVEQAGVVLVAGLDLCDQDVAAGTGPVAGGAGGVLRQNRVQVVEAVLVQGKAQMHQQVVQLGPVGQGSQVVVHGVSFRGWWMKGTMRGAAGGAHHSCAVVAQSRNGVRSALPPLGSPGQDADSRGRTSGGAGDG